MIAIYNAQAQEEMDAQHTTARACFSCRASEKRANPRGRLYDQQGNRWHQREHGEVHPGVSFAGQEARQNDAPPSSVSGLRPLGPYLLLRLDQISRANSLLASGSIALISATALETAMFPPSPSNNSRSSIRIYQHAIDTTAIHGRTRTGERAFGHRDRLLLTELMPAERPLGVLRVTRPSVRSTKWQSSANP